MPGFHGGMMEGEAARCTFMGDVDSELINQVAQVTTESHERQQAEALNPELIDQHHMEMSMGFDDLDVFVEKRPVSEISSRTEATKPESSEWQTSTTELPTKTDKQKKPQEEHLVDTTADQSVHKKLTDQESAQDNATPQHQESAPAEPAIVAPRIRLIPKTIVVENLIEEESAVTADTSLPAQPAKRELHAVEHTIDVIREHVIATSSDVERDEPPSEALAPPTEVRNVSIHVDTAPTPVEAPVIEQTAEESLTLDDSETPTPEARTDTEPIIVVPTPEAMVIDDAEAADAAQVAPLFTEMHTAITDMVELSEDVDSAETRQTLDDVTTLLEELTAILGAPSEADDLQDILESDVDESNGITASQTQIEQSATNVVERIDSDISLVAQEVTETDVELIDTEMLEKVSAIVEQLFAKTGVDKTSEEVRSFAIALLRSATLVNHNASPSEITTGFDRGTHENLIRLLSQVKQLRHGTINALQRFIGHFALGRLHSFEAQLEAA